MASPNQHKRLHLRSYMADLHLAVRHIVRQPLKAVVAAGPIITAIAAVTFVLGLGTGLESYMRDRLQSFTPTLWIEEPLTAPEAVRQRLSSSAGVTTVSRSVTGPVLVHRGSTTVPAKVVAYERETIPELLPGAEDTIIGHMPGQSHEAVIGGELARRIGLQIGDALEITSPGGTQETITISGVTDAGLADIDGALLLMDIALADDLLGAAGERGFSVSAARHVDVEALRLAIQEATGLWVVPWYEGRHALLSAVEVERRVLFWISLASVVTASFATAGITALRVMERRYDIAVLQALGGTVRNIVRTVLTEALIIGAAGAVIGSIVGWLACAALARQPVALPAQFGLAYIPVDPRIDQSLQAIGLALASTLVAALIPAVRAGSLTPSEGLRRSFS